MDIFVYSDESGVFDKKHNNTYVYGGLIFLGKQEKDVNVRKYIKAESNVRMSGGYADTTELKASLLKNKEKYSIYRSLNNCIKFGAVINQQNVLEEVFANKKSKQRYLDYVYILCLKRAFEALITRGDIKNDQIKNIHVFVDEHTTATSGKYELREGMEQEFKFGTFNKSYNSFNPPVFNQLNGVTLKFCSSNSVNLIRAADIVANRIYFGANNACLPDNSNLLITILP
ncbi:MAG: DUF3800 domain-containing protein [Oscillospiraceae bacterium]|nr:DUF3800 domain-containing protein [Oscillospiraceae bacterium]